MPAGYSTLRYIDQPAPPHDLVLDNCYYLINLHQAQAYFQASALTRPAFLTLSSVTESPFQPGQQLKSLYHVSTFQKNQPFRLPINVNLSSFLPARQNDVLRITLNYIVTRDNPFQKLANKMKSINLVSKISAASLEWGIAVKVSEITAQLLSYLLDEGGETTTFELVVDLNISTLHSGFYAAYGSPYNNVEPNILRIDRNNELQGDEYLSRFCFVVLRIVTIPALEEETARSRVWWNLLQTEKEKVLLGIQGNNRQKEMALREWNTTLLHVNDMARKDGSFLLKEIRQIIGEAQQEIDAKLKSGQNLEGYGTTNMYPPEWQSILGVEDGTQLQNLVRDYQDAVNITKELLRAYELGR
jgi:hypothetical protein